MIVLVSMKPRLTCSRSHFGLLAGLDLDMTSFPGWCCSPYTNLLALSLPLHAEGPLRVLPYSSRLLVTGPSSSLEAVSGYVPILVAFLCYNGKQLSEERELRLYAASRMVLEINASWIKLPRRVHNGQEEAKWNVLVFLTIFFETLFLAAHTG